MLVTFRLIRLLPIIFKNGGILSVRTNHKHVIKKLKKIRKKKRHLEWRSLSFPVLQPWDAVEHSHWPCRLAFPGNLH